MLKTLLFVVTGQKIVKSTLKAVSIIRSFLSGERDLQPQEIVEDAIYPD